MDGAANETCKYSCPKLSNNTPNEFSYVQRYNAHGDDVLGPYITLAQTYGWANKMFATNQGPSFPAHQFIYGATSAPTQADDGGTTAGGTYAAENIGLTSPDGCVTVVDQHDNDDAVQLIVNGVEDQTTPQIYPCFQHETLGTLLGANQWKYYTSDPSSLWTAPNAIESECGGSNQGGTYSSCQGPEFLVPGGNVVTPPQQILTDIANCQLANVSWVTPKGQYSDHAHSDTDYGPSWVATIVNNIGTSTCTDNGTKYWKDTAIVITWDDWGGWYDHEPPLLNFTEYYQLGFRVPMLFVSAYGANNNNGTACQPVINNNDILDFGSIANFVERNFLGSEGILGFADLRAETRTPLDPDLRSFYNLGQNPCNFVPIPTLVSTSYFLNDNSQATPTDDE